MNPEEGGVGRRGHSVMDCNHFQIDQMVSKHKKII
jgi:hypothetical protein